MDLSELTTRMAGAEDVEFDALAMRQALSAADIKAALQSAWDYAADKPQNVLAAASPLLGAGMGAAIAGKGNRKKGAAAGGLLGLSPAAVLGVQMLQKALNKPGFPADRLPSVPTDTELAADEFSRPYRFPAEGPVDPRAVAEAKALKMVLDSIGANEEDWAAVNRLLNENGSTRLPPDLFTERSQ